MDADNGAVAATAKGNVLTSLLKAVGIKTIGCGSSATVEKGRGTALRVRRKPTRQATAPPWCRPSTMARAIAKLRIAR
jgi:hypothetical protein